MIDNARWIRFERNSSDVISFKRKLNFIKTIKKASIEISAIGWFRLYLNDSRIDTSYFNPGWTDYRKRTFYYSFDITDKLKPTTDFVVDLASGWGGTTRMPAWVLADQYSYWPKAVIFSLDIIFEDDEHLTINSDDSFDVYDHKISFATLYDGETCDFLYEPKFLGKAVYADDIKTCLLPNEGPDIVEGERFEAQKMFKDNNGDLIIDFGQNFAGLVEINIDAKNGDEIVFTPGEVLDKEGNFYNKNYRSAKSLYSYKLSEKEKTFKQTFSFLGGRYIKLIKYPSYISASNFVGILLHSDLKRTCYFESGNSKINRLYKNVIYGQLSNYIDVPTDCPQRDERLGWTADAQVFTKTASINFDVRKFFNKWLGDLILDQHENGSIDGVCPLSNTMGNWISTGWGDACTIIPMTLYETYGEKEVLEKSFDMMQKWVKFLSNNYKKPYIVELPFSYGDWLALDKFQNGENQGLTRYDLLSTAFYAYSLEILIKSAKILGREYSDYAETLEKVKEAFQSEFINSGHMNGQKVTLFCSGERTCYTQTGIVFTLHLNLCKEEDRASLTKDLEELIHECGDKMSTGFVGTPFILHTLSENGLNDLAYTLLFQEGFPSWLYSVNKGATTMWEHYDGIKEDGTFWFDSMNSFNHYAYGAVFDWIFKYTMGISGLEPAYKKVRIQPIIDKRLEYINSSFETKFGTIVSNWKIEKDKVLYSIVVPEGISGEIILNGTTYSFENGYKIEVII